MYSNLVETAFKHLGILPRELRQLTAMEYRAMMKAASDNRIIKIQDDRSLAWHIAIFNAGTKVKDALPSHDMVIKITPDSPQTELEIAIVLNTLVKTLPDLVQVRKMTQEEIDAIDD